ncbi:MULTISPECIES: response regulator [Cobetia]|uniref:Transcriptional regulatory protein n=1 Tax=Cobetia crustatorum TaxID=553385 RepID=A0A558HUH9_9GAMM|nr:MULTISPECIES: response regulator [Cobetia]TVU72790.1 response regulator [Cobetia crustatorum]
MRVLIVEDDPMVMRLNVEYLNRVAGMRLVAQCEDVASALDVLAAEEVDLVLLDIYLRSRNGLEVLRWLRRHAAPEIQVILITAAGEAETVRSAHALGVCDYLIKPFSFARFQQALALASHGRQQLASLDGEVNQHQLDRLFSPHAEGAAPSVDDGRLPKGVTAVSLALVAGAIQALPRDEGSFTSEALLATTGMSRVTIRKYLRHLATRSLLSEAFHYGQVGRPSFTYQVVDRPALARLCREC